MSSSLTVGIQATNYMQAADIIQLLKDEETEFLSHVKGIKHERSAMRNVEGLMLWSLTKHYKPEIFLESGVYRARSSEMICIAAQRFGVSQVYSFEVDKQWEKYVRKKMSKYSNWNYFIESGDIGFEAVCNSWNGHPIAASIDGPKFGQPLENCIKTLSLSPELKFVLIHDITPKSKTRRITQEAYTRFFDPKKFGFFDCDQYTIPLTIVQNVNQYIKSHYSYHKTTFAEFGIIYLI